MKISEPKLKKVLDALDLREAAELVKRKYKTCKLQRDSFFSVLIFF